MYETEKDLIADALNGNQGAYTELYNRSKPKVKACVFKHLSFLSDAEREDLVANIINRGLLKLSTFKSESTFATWMYAITIRMIRMYIRHRKREKEDLNKTFSLEFETVNGIIMDRHLASSDRSFQQVEAKIDLEKILATLPIGYKTMLELKYLEGLTQIEVAQLLTVSYGNFKSQSFKGLEKAKDFVSTRGKRSSKSSKTLHFRKCLCCGEEFLPEIARQIFKEGHSSKGNLQVKAFV